MKKQIGIEVTHGRTIKLKRFLKDNGAYSSFRKNFFNQRDIRTVWVRKSFTKSYTENTPNGAAFKIYCKSIPVYEYIRYAFRWSETKEGFTFWDDLDKLWRKII